MKRRQFLKSSKHLAMSSAYFYGLQSLMDICLRSNFAQAQVSSGINYLNIQIPGAPPRWMFDQPLNPMNKANQFVAGSFGTEIIKKGGKFEAIHKGQKISFGGQDFWLPPVWSLNSQSNGKPFKDLLNNTLIIRGIDMEINSHPVNQTRTVRPVASRPSIHGLVADKSILPLAATGSSLTGGTKAFKNESGISIIGVTPSDPIPGLIAAFKGKVTKASELSLNEVNVIEALDAYALSKGVASMGAEKQQMAAYEMFERNLDSFNSKWDGLYKKYQNIVAQEINAPFPGITSANPIADGSTPYNFERGAGDTINGPLRDQITSQTRNNKMAQAFAFAEFALVEKLSSAVSVVTAGSVLEALKDIGNLRTDQHFVGSVTSTYYTSIMYRALISCLSELVGALKVNGLFDNTVIHIMSEFSRTPKANKEGSDHGFKGSSATIISGMIRTPGLVGNVYKESPDSTVKARYPGTWGEAAPFFKNPDRPIVNDDIVNTLCEMLEVKKIAVKGQSLIKKTGGNVEWLKQWEVKNV